MTGLLWVEGRGIFSMDHMGDGWVSAKFLGAF